MYFTILIVLSSLCLTKIESISIIKDNNQLVDSNELKYYMEQTENEWQKDDMSNKEEEILHKLISYQIDKLNNRLTKRNRRFRSSFTNLELCKNVNCSKIHSNGQVSKTWRVAQLVSCCPSLRNKKKIF